MSTASVLVVVPSVTWVGRSSYCTTTKFEPDRGSMPVTLWVTVGESDQPVWESLARMVLPLTGAVVRSTVVRSALRLGYKDSALTPYFRPRTEPVLPTVSVTSALASSPKDTILAGLNFLT